MSIDQFWTKNKDTIFRIAEIVCYIIIVGSIWMCLKIFLWEREIHFKDPDYVADAEILGNFGDFMAGTIGCVIAVVSMYLLFRTLKSQRAATISNNQLMTVQRFNDLFFRLIDLYRQLSYDLVVSPTQKISVDERRAIIVKTECRDKDYFDTWRNVIGIGTQNNPTFNGINQQTLKYYHVFYNQNKNKLGAYFRTLYRILELINDSEISDNDKRNYSKILRAQLCESELFMLYYNSQTELGIKLGKFLWKYHILKHLPVYETIEFKTLYPNLTETERAEIDRIYTIILSSIKKLVKEFQSKTLSYTVEDDNFSITFECIPTRQPDKTCHVNISVMAKKLDIYSSEPNLSQFSCIDWGNMFNNLLSIINVFSKHTIFSSHSNYTTSSFQKRVFIFTLISYRNSTIQ